MSAITQLYSLCMYHFQNLNFNRSELRGEGAVGWVGLMEFGVNLPNK